MVLIVLVPDAVVVPLIPQVVRDPFKPPKLVYKVRPIDHTSFPVSRAILRQPVTLIFHIFYVEETMVGPGPFFKRPQHGRAVFPFTGAKVIVPCAPLGEFGMGVVSIDDQEFVTI